MRTRVSRFQKASQGKRDREMVRAYAVHLDENLRHLARHLESGSLRLGRFHEFVIRDPKERIITAPHFEERVLHHAVMNVCEPWFDRWLIDDTYACRRGRGRDAAVIRAAGLSARWGWCVQMDVRRFFDSIPHDLLLARLRGRFKDPRLLDLFERIVAGYRGAVGVGLPIGSLTSQHLANFYLGACDRFVKEQLRLPGYVRYMDDLVLWDSDRERLTAGLAECQQYLAAELRLTIKPSSVQRTSQGLPFLGTRIYSTHVALSRRSRCRWQRRIRILELAVRLGLISERDAQQRLEAATDFVRRAGVSSWRFRQAVLQRRLVSDP